MTSITKLMSYGAALCVTALLFTGAPASAQSTGTTVEFTTATRLPGITLEPGSYVFRLGEAVGKRRVVEVYSSDGTKKIATLLTVDYATPRSANVTTVMYDDTDPQVLRAWYAPGAGAGREFIYPEEEALTLGQAARSIGQAARTVAGVAKDISRKVADVAVEVWDDVSDNATLVNPTETRLAAERHLDAAEKAYDDLEDRVSGDVETRLQPLGTNIEMLEDAFEEGQSWMGHYTAVMSSLDALAPERPVGTSGGGARLDASTTAALMSIRGHLRAFHAQAMK